MQVVSRVLVWLFAIPFVEIHAARLVAREKVSGRMRKLLVDALDHTMTGMDRLLDEEHCFHALDVCDAIRNKSYSEAVEAWQDFMFESPCDFFYSKMLLDAWASSPHHYQFHKDWC